MSRYWTIVNHPKQLPIALELTPVKPEIMEAIAKNATLKDVIGIPIYFHPGMGVWPKNDGNCIVVQQIQEDKI